MYVLIERYARHGPLAILHLINRFLVKQLMLNYSRALLQLRMTE